jgi:uncharacterized protein
MRSSWAPRSCRVEVAFTALKHLLLAGVIGYLAIAGLVWLGQERLIFYPQPATQRPSAPPGWRLEHVSFTAADGTQLVGVLVLPPIERPGLVIYFGGNAEEVTSFAPLVADLYGERAVLLVNYRGYGESGGKPGETALVADGAALFDWAVRRGDFDASRIALHGRSLGAGVAVQVAAMRPAKCVILTSPFDSALEIAKATYPWLPISLLIRHPFDSMARAPGILAPALFLMGTTDTLIPMGHSERLAAAWGGAVERVSFEGFGHNDIELNPRYADTLRSFLDRHL